MSVEQFFGPSTKDIAARFANDKTVVLEQTTDLVFEIALNLNQLGATVENCADRMTRQALDLNLLVSTALHDPRQAHRVIRVAFVDLHRQRCLGVTCIDAEHR